MKTLIIFLAMIGLEAHAKSLDLKCASNAKEAAQIISTVEDCFICNFNLELYAGFPKVVIFVDKPFTAYADGNLVDPLYKGGRHTEVFLPPDSTYVEFLNDKLKVVAEGTITLKPGAVCSLEIK